LLLLVLFWSSPTTAPAAAADADADADAAALLSAVSSGAKVSRLRRPPSDAVVWFSFFSSFSMHQCEKTAVLHL